jgi:PPOX class probable F420-dependent enzyme
MATLHDVVRIGAGDRFLVVVPTLRANGTIQASVVNAGVLPHPISAEQAVAFVTYGPAKLTNLRARPQVTVTFRAGWEWVTVEGTAEIAGPDDAMPGIDAERLRLLRREVFAAAGGSHDDWDEYDRVMAAERRAVVLVTPVRVYSNAT